jgi:hypothetical protein
VTYIHDFEEVTLLDRPGVNSRNETLEVSYAVEEGPIAYLEIWDFACPVVECATKSRVGHDIVYCVETAISSESLKCDIKLTGR